MFARLIGMLLVIITTIVILALAVANRQEVHFNLDPFNSNDPTIYLSVPFSMFIFLSLALGAFLGGVASWMSQGKWRKEARQRTQEAMRWKVEAERLAKEYDNT
ncbi:MAG: hypothetical protein TECD_00997 [Hyphomicrobiaceae bacterium hypho_1]